MGKATPFFELVKELRVAQRRFDVSHNLKDRQRAEKLARMVDVEIVKVEQQMLAMVAEGDHQLPLVTDNEGVL